LTFTKTLQVKDKEDATGESPKVPLATVLVLLAFPCGPDTLPEQEIVEARIQV